MGLLLSILVTCVGVVELLAFYQNVRRRVNCPPVTGSVATIHARHLNQLETIKSDLTERLNQLKQLPTFKLNSHEDIEVEFKEKVVASRSRSPTPRRFLLSEKKTSRSPSPVRQFVVSEEPQELQKSKAQQFLPEYLIEQRSQSNGIRYVLTNENGPVSLPLPEKFVVSEPEPKTEIFRKKLGHGLVEVDGELYYRRSPSPFPSFELTAPRNSICSDHLDDSSVVEVDEPASRSHSASPLKELKYSSQKADLILQNSDSAHATHDYWGNNKILQVPKKSKSRSPSPLKNLTAQQRSLSDSNFQDLNEITHKAISCVELTRNNSDDDDNGASSDNEAKNYSEEMKDSLDGIDKNSKGCVKKKLIKKKRVKMNRLSGDEEKKKNKDSSKSTDSGPKRGEPFWVNRAEN